MLRSFLFRIPGELDTYVQAACYLDAIAMLTTAGHDAYLLVGWSD